MPICNLILAFLVLQVISLDLRSNLSEGKKLNGHKGDSEGRSEGEEELRYTHILNRVLPPDIRVLAWAPVEPDFSARFSCLKRTYRYFFPCADLDVALMHTAAQRYVGTHDFRNLCKMDVANGVVNFQRTILSAGVTWVERGGETGPQDPFRLCQFEVTGQAFLYHQVRCMMAILFLIGQKMESPEIIDELLDVQKNPQKPQYRYRELGKTSWAASPKQWLCAKCSWQAASLPDCEAVSHNMEASCQWPHWEVSKRISFFLLLDKLLMALALGIWLKLIQFLAEKGVLKTTGLVLAERTG